jgi:hypothetical protein
MGWKDWHYSNSDPGNLHRTTVGGKNGTTHTYLDGSVTSRDANGNIKIEREASTPNSLGTIAVGLTISDLGKLGKD